MQSKWPKILVIVLGIIILILLGVFIFVEPAETPTLEDTASSGSSMEY